MSFYRHKFSYLISWQYQKVKLLAQKIGIFWTLTRNCQTNFWGDFITLYSEQQYSNCSVSVFGIVSNF